jgi:tetratricopeptide (TPR) repeat protein
MLTGKLSKHALLPVFSAFLAVTAKAEPVCNVDEAQRLFGQQPRPVAEVRVMLSACEAAGSTDYRVYMFQGVMMREAGDREGAIAPLRKAHELAPKELNPALELGFTLEEKHALQAAKVYEEVLARDPENKAALLGMGRIYRGQNELDKAAAIYEQLLKANPQDADALNGMAWIALANRRRVAGQEGFEKVLAIDPHNEEAKVGLSMAPDVYRYVFDASGTWISTSSGTSWGFGGDALIGVTAFDTIELGEYHYTNELQTLTAIGVATLPSDDVRVGYHRLVPLTYAFSLVYDYRGHNGLPTEHWFDANGAIYVTDYLRLFGGYRQAWGAFQWDGRLIRGGVAVSLSQSWEVSGAIYDAAQAIFNNYFDIWSWVADVTWHGPHNALVIGGVGYSPLIDNVDLHGRAILPVTDRIALQVAVGHNSINADTRATVGLRFNW